MFVMAISYSILCYNFFEMCIIIHLIIKNPRMLQGMLNPPSMSDTVHPSKEVSDIRNLSTSSLTGALNSVGWIFRRVLKIY